MNDGIYVTNADGSGTPESLTNDPSPDSKPDWGPLPDKTPQEITLTAPADSATYLLNQRVISDYSCRDEAGGSGLLSCAGPVPAGDPLDSTTVGTRTFTVEAADEAGNTVSESHDYGVVYDFGGLFSPDDNPPTMNTVKAGRAVPVKFGLGGNQGLDVFAEGYPRSVPLASDPDAPQDAVAQTEAAGESSLSYDPAKNLYTYVWKTEKAWAGEARQLVIELDDGSEHRACFDFN